MRRSRIFNDPRFGRGLLLGGGGGGGSGTNIPDIGLDPAAYDVADLQHYLDPDLELQADDTTVAYTNRGALADPTAPATSGSLPTHRVGSFANGKNQMLWTTDAMGMQLPKMVHNSGSEVYTFIGTYMASDLGGVLGQFAFYSESRMDQDFKDQLTISGWNTAPKSVRTFHRDDGLNLTQDFYHGHRSIFDNNTYDVPVVVCFRKEATRERLYINGECVYNGASEAGPYFNATAHIGCIRDQNSTYDPPKGIGIGRFFAWDTVLDEEDILYLMAHEGRYYDMEWDMFNLGVADESLFVRLNCQDNAQSMCLIGPGDPGRQAEVADATLDTINFSGRLSSFRLNETASQMPHRKSGVMSAGYESMEFTPSDEAGYLDGVNVESFQRNGAFSMFMVAQRDGWTTIGAKQGLLVSHMGGDFNSWKHAFRWMIYQSGGGGDNDWRINVLGTESGGSQNRAITSDIITMATGVPMIVGFSIECGVGGDIWLNGAKRTLDFDDVADGTNDWGGHGEKWYVGGQPDPNGSVNFKGHYGDCVGFDKRVSDSEAVAIMDKLNADFGGSIY